MGDEVDCFWFKVEGVLVVINGSLDSDGLSFISVLSMIILLSKLILLSGEIEDVWNNLILFGGGGDSTEVDGDWRFLFVVYDMIWNNFILFGGGGDSTEVNGD